MGSSRDSLQLVRIGVSLRIGHDAWSGLNSRLPGLISYFLISRCLERIP